MSSLILTVREAMRYRGRSGHWSWVAHRLSGLSHFGLPHHPCVGYGQCSFCTTYLRMVVGRFQASLLWCWRNWHYGRRSVSCF